MHPCSRRTFLLLPSPTLLFPTSHSSFHSIALPPDSTRIYLVNSSARRPFTSLDEARDLVSATPRAELELAVAQRARTGKDWARTSPHPSLPCPGHLGCAPPSTFLLGPCSLSVIALLTARYRTPVRLRSSSSPLPSSPLDATPCPFLPSLPFLAQRPRPGSHLRRCDACSTPPSLALPPPLPLPLTGDLLPLTHQS